MIDKANNERKVSVVINDLGGHPQFTFSGMWSGKDAANVSRHMFKAYRKYMNNIRAKSISHKAKLAGTISTSKIGA